MNYPDHDFLYQFDSFVVKENRKAKLSHGDQEYSAQEMCYQHISSFRHAIDIGARYGGWSRIMAERFKKLSAFEPRFRWQFVYPLNIKMQNVQLYPYGLGEIEEKVGMIGNRIVSKKPKEYVEIKTLDSFNFKAVDFIKIDTDGYELNVLKGGIKTILKWKPIICMEVINNESFHGKIAQDFLIQHKAKILDRNGINVLFGW